jgi:hypothetical protein
MEQIKPYLPYLLTLLGSLGTIVVSLLRVLYSEALLKRVTVLLLSRIARKTKNRLDNAVVLQLKKAWGLEDVK